MSYPTDAAEERRYNGTVSDDSPVIICFVRSMSSMILLAGGGVAITAGATWHLTVSHQHRSSPFPFNLYF